jgi:hypothetical protein
VETSRVSDTLEPAPNKTEGSRNALMTLEALKKSPPDAKVYYEMGPNGPGTIGKAQYVKAGGESNHMGVLLDR